MPPTRGSAGRVIAPVWRCTGWGLPSRHVSVSLVRSYRTFSPLPSTLAGRFGGVLSVALSVGFPRLGVTQHPALRCPDFPRASRCRGARGCLARGAEDSYLQGAPGSRPLDERQRPPVAAPAPSRASRAAGCPGHPPSRRSRRRCPAACGSAGAAPDGQPTPAALRPRSASPVEFETVEVPAAPAQPAPGSRCASSQRTAPRTAGSLAGRTGRTQRHQREPRRVGIVAVRLPSGRGRSPPVPAGGAARSARRVARARPRRRAPSIASESSKTVAPYTPSPYPERIRATRSTPAKQRGSAPAATAASAALAAAPGGLRSVGHQRAQAREVRDPGAMPAATSASTVSASTPSSLPGGCAARNIAPRRPAARSTGGGDDVRSAVAATAAAITGRR